MEATQRLQHAIALAQAGERDRARALLREIVRDEPQSEVAWLWLSAVVDDPREQLDALERAQAINPANARTPARIAQARRRLAQAAPPDPRIATAQRALAAGRRAEARALLRQIVQDDEGQVEAWWLLAAAAVEVPEQIAALQRVLALDPQHRAAHEALIEAQDLVQNPLALGDYYTAAGETNLAVAAYARAYQAGPAAGAQLEAGQRAARVRRLAQSAGFVPRYPAIAPALTLARLALGPPVLYGLMWLLQTGFDPRQTPLLLCLGAPAVVIGSLLMVAVDMRPRHPAVAALVGEGAVLADTRRAAVWLAGVLLTAGAFGLFLSDAIVRLAAYAAALPNGGAP
jgi:hypothetical protein